MHSRHLGYRRKKRLLLLDKIKKIINLFNNVKKVYKLSEEGMNKCVHS